MVQVQPQTPMTQTLNRVFTVLVRAVLLAAGVVFTLSLLLAGFVLAVVAVVAGLVLGRRPAWRAHFERGTNWQRFRRPGGMGMPPRPGRPEHPMGEVIDAEVREVVTTGPSGAPDASPGASSR